jgi:cell wall-associated NlpC family hydrolase
MIPRPQRARCTLLPRESVDRPNAAAVFAILFAAALLLSPLLVLVPAPAAASVPSSTALTAHSASTARFGTGDDLLAARHEAEQLRARLVMLRSREDWTNERLAYVQGMLADAATRSVSAEQELAVLQGVDLQASADLAHRVRAIEQSGGVMALYAEAWDGSTFGDVASNIASLDAVIGLDADSAAQATSDITEAALLQQRLAAITDERAKLVGRARQLADDATRLLAEQQALLSDSNAEVRQLARQLAKEREAAAAAAAAKAARFAAGGSTTAGSTPYAAGAVAAALSKLGSTYVWGAEGPDTFDCSGLVQWSYAQAGLSLPRLASDQYFASTPVAVGSMQPGDVLVYAYDPSDESTIHHIAIYIGNGQMVHAPKTGDVVRVVPVYYDGLYGVGRPGL